MQLFRKTSVNKSSHKTHLELKEGHSARVVGIEPLEHSLEIGLFLSGCQVQLEGAQHGLTDRFDFINIEPSAAVSIGLLEGFTDEALKCFFGLFILFLLLLLGFVDEIVELKGLLVVDAD